MKIPEFPFQQGDLDYLCYVYAAVNLLYLRGEIKSSEGAASKFQTALNWIATKGNLFRATTQGMGQADVAEMLDLLKLPVDLILRPTRSEVHAASDNGALIFVKGVDWDHYTVIQATKGKRTVELFDSYGFQGFRSVHGKWFIDTMEVEITHLFIPYR